MFSFFWSPNVEQLVGGVIIKVEVRGCGKKTGGYKILTIPVP